MGFVVMVTSEENSYGLLAGKRWFDGNVQDGVKFNMMGNGFRNIEVIEYRNMESTCSYESYYECLARRLLNLDTKEISITTQLNSNKCSFCEKCTPFSLPMTAEKIPICQNDTCRSCSQNIIHQLERDQHAHCKRSCIVKEFTKIPSNRGFGHRIILYHYQTAEVHYGVYHSHPV